MTPLFLKVNPPKNKAFFKPKQGSFRSFQVFCTSSRKIGSLSILSFRALFGQGVIESPGQQIYQTFWVPGLCFQLEPKNFSNAKNWWEDFTRMTIETKQRRIQHFVDALPS